MKQIKKKRIMLWLGSVIMMLVMAVSLVPVLNGQAAVSTNKISLNKTSISVKEGITGKITVKNKPARAKILWSSKDKKIATVKKGVVTGLKQGQTVVSCKVVYQKGPKKLTPKLKATVKVRKNRQVYPKCTKGKLKGVHFVGRNNGTADKKKRLTGHIRSVVQ